MAIKHRSGRLDQIESVAGLLSVTLVVAAELEHNLNGTSRLVMSSVGVGFINCALLRLQSGVLGGGLHQLVEWLIFVAVASGCSF